MNLLITGVAGFIGSKISHAALQKGYNVYGVDDLSQCDEKNVPEGVKFIKIDLSDSNQLNNLPPNIDVIMHLAGQSSGEVSFDNPVLDLKKNTISTLNLLEYGIQQKTERIIYASSMSVYGAIGREAVSEEHPCAPLSCYGIGKLTSENYLKLYQNRLPCITFRMFNVYGPGQDMNNLRQGMVSIYLQYALTKSHIPVKGSLKRYRDFIYIDDVVDVWLQAIHNKEAMNKVFNLGTGIRTTVEALLRKIKLLLPDTTWTEISNTPGDQFGIYADISNLRNCFDVSRFYELDVGLKKFVEHVQ